MLTEQIIPRFNDTDALGHINNASIVTWFEVARRPIFELFVPNLDPKKWNLILARVEVDYLAQTYYQIPVTIKTYFEKIGNSSMTLVQEAWQEKKMVVKGKSIMVHFDYQSNISKPIPESIRKELEKHLER